jgi:hypothetical protein
MEMSDAFRGRRTRAVLHADQGASQGSAISGFRRGQSGRSSDSSAPVIRRGTAGLTTLAVNPKHAVLVLREVSQGGISLDHSTREPEAAARSWGCRHH